MLGICGATRLDTTINSDDCIQQTLSVKASKRSAVTLLGPQTEYSHCHTRKGHREKHSSLHTIHCIQIPSRDVSDDDLMRRVAWWHTTTRWSTIHDHLLFLVTNSVIPLCQQQWLIFGCRVQLLGTTNCCPLPSTLLKFKQ
jgi:hypothetical protein